MRFLCCNPCALNCLKLTAGTRSLPFPLLAIYPGKGCGNLVNVKYLVVLKYVDFLFQLDKVVCKKQHIFWSPTRYTKATSSIYNREHLIHGIGDNRQWYCWEPGAQRCDPESSNSRKPLPPLGWREKGRRVQGGQPVEAGWF